MSTTFRKENFPIFIEDPLKSRHLDHFTHLKSGETASNKTLLMTAILSEAINLGLRKMAEWLQAWHIRDETYSAALSELVNAQLKHPFAAHWGDGTTSSSDGQYFRSGGHARDGGITLKTEVSLEYSSIRTSRTNIPHSILR